MKQNNHIEHPFDRFVNEQMQDATWLPPEGCWEEIQQHVGEAINSGAENINTSPLSQSVVLKITAALFSAAALTSLIVYLSSQSPVVPPVDSPPLQEVVQESMQPAHASLDEESKTDLLEIQSEEKDIPQDENAPVKDITEANTPNRVEEDPAEMTEGIYNNDSNLPVQDPEESEDEPDIQPVNTPEKPATHTQPKEIFTELLVLADTFLCDKSFHHKIQFFGSHYIQADYALFMGQKYQIKELFSLQIRPDQKVRIRGFDASGNRYIRGVSLNSQSLTITPQNLNEGTLNLKLESSNHCQQIYWYVNNELKYTDVKDITYTRNMEFEHNQPLDVRVICYNANGCPDSLNLDAVPYLYDVRVPQIPSLFTPNSDGVNDLWSVKLYGEKHFNLKVYDMNNMLVFESSDKNKAWDGTDRKGNILPSGWYVFNLEYAYPDESGVTRRNGMVQLKRE